MKNLATIQKIKSIRKHENSDNLELADVLGWQVVVKKGEFHTGDLCVYVVIDTILPEDPEFEFLRNKNFRIKPIRLRGEYSNGICFPLSILEKVGNRLDTWRDPVDGMDVTDFLGIKHYEKPLPTQLAGDAYGRLPGFLIMTDEDNLRSCPSAVAELIGSPFYITRKDDGSSGTFFVKDGKFGVCSRRIWLKENPENGFWRMAEKYNLEAAIKNYFPEDVAIQGEVVGPGIQGNPLGLSELELHVFSIFNIQLRSYFPHFTLTDFCTQNEIPAVSLVETGDNFQYTLEDLITKSREVKYPNGNPAEGIVIRPKNPLFSTVMNKTWSGKIINDLYKETEPAKVIAKGSEE